MDSPIKRQPNYGTVPESDDELQVKDKATRRIAHLLIEDLKTGVLKLSEPMTDSQYEACLDVYGYGRYVDDTNIKYKVAWEVNQWATRERQKVALLKNKDGLAVKIAGAFADLCTTSRRYTYSQLCDFITGCCGELDSELAAKVASLVDYKLAKKGVCPLAGYDEEYCEVIERGG